MLALARRAIYPVMMIVVPICSAFFFFNLMEKGVVEEVPVGLVDLDNSDLSRVLTRNLKAMEQVSISKYYLDYGDALDAVQRGEIYGFFYIPADFSTKALGGKQPTLSYYIDYSYFTPASMQFKGFKTLSVLANGAIVQTALTTAGMTNEAAAAILQPVVTHVHPIGNPWMNYNYYLSSSFVPGLLALLVMLVTAYSIGIEWSAGTSRRWVATGGDSMIIALTTKLVPQSLIFIAVGFFIQMMMYRWYGFPLNCPVWHMMAAMVLLVLSNQAFAVAVCALVPTFRFSTTVCTLFGMLSFSFCGFSMPQEAMYPPINAIGWIMPIKYYFLINADQALNGLELYYSRWYYIAMMLYLLLPLPLLWRLKQVCKNQIYVG